MPEVSFYLVEFLTIATVHLLAVASPGPDFAIVLRYSVSYGRRAAVIASVGIGLGILVHVAYSLLGIGLLIKNSPALFNILKLLAASYLLYIGIMAIKASQGAGEDNSNGSGLAISDRKAFITGFVTNGLNPKATLFFLSVFAVVISVKTPTEVRLAYGIYMAVATAIWFVSISMLLSSTKVREKLNQYGYWFDRLMGAILIILALKLLVDDLI